MDPTVAPCPLRYLPYYDMDVEALVIKDGTALWKHTPHYTIYGSSRISSTTAVLAPDGSFTGSTTVTYKGEFARSRSERFGRSDKQGLSTEIESAVKSYIEEVKIESCRLVRAESRPPSVVVEADFSRSGGAIFVDDNLIVRRDFLRPSVFGLADISGSAERRFPLWFAYAWSERDTLRLVPPPGWEIAKAPEACDLRTEFGTYRTWNKSENHEFGMVTDYELRADRVAVRNLDRFLDFWRTVRTRSTGEIVFRQTDPENGLGDRD